MDLRKSLKSGASSSSSFNKQRTRGISASNADDEDLEQRPILFCNHESPPTSSDEGSPNMRHSASLKDPEGRREVIVKIDGDSMEDDEGEFEFPYTRRSKDMTEDPPLRLIEQFLDKQKAVGGETCLDMDLEMDELRHRHRHNNSLDNNNNKSPCSSCSTNLFPPPDPHHHHSNNNSGSKDLKVHFMQQAEDSTPPRSNIVVDIVPASDGDQYEPNAGEDSLTASSNDEADDEVERQQQHSRRRTSGMINSNSNIEMSGDGQVVRCTSSFQRRAAGSSLAERMMNKTKSRLMDVPDIVHVSEKKSGRLGKSVPMRSGMVMPPQAGAGKGGGGEEEEEDSLLDDDIPDDFKKAKIDALTLAQWISLIIIVTALICSRCFPWLRAVHLRGLRLWKWEVLILVLICGRLVSGWAIRVAVFFIERNFLLRKRLLYFVYGVRKAVQNCIWLGMFLIAWYSMFDNKVEGNNNEFLQFVNNFMVCMLIGIVLWLAKTLMVKVLASSFHVNKFFDRIQESLFNQYIIETLSGPPLKEMQHQREEEDRALAEVKKLQNAGAKLPPELTANIAFKHSKSRNNNRFSKVSGEGGGTTPTRVSGVISSSPISDEHGGQQGGITIDHLHRLNPKNVSAWNMKRLVKIVRHGVLSTLDEQCIHCTPQGYDDSSNQIRSENEAKLAARKIFRNVAKPKSNFIYLVDLLRFLREDEAVQVMNLLDGSTDCERISKSSLKNWVVNAFRERRALALTLDDTKTAVKKLHQMVNVLVSIIIFLIGLVILGIATGRILLYISSQVVIVAFIFGNTCKNVFEAIIFLFVIHPFDVGDRCEVDGVEMVVEEMNILTTVFLRGDNQKIHFPNSTLAIRPIGNFYRSPDMGDAIEFLVHIATPMEKIKVMNQRIVSYVESKKEHWYPSPMVVLMDMEDINKLKMSVWLRHRMNFQDMGEKWLRRSQVVEEMVKIFRELDIDYRLYPVDINVRAMPPVQSTRLPPKWQPPTNTSDSSHQ